MIDLDRRQLLAGSALALAGPLTASQSLAAPARLTEWY